MSESFLTSTPPTRRARGLGWPTTIGAIGATLCASVLGGRVLLRGQGEEPRVSDRSGMPVALIEPAATNHELEASQQQSLGKADAPAATHGQDGIAEFAAPTIEEIGLIARPVASDANASIAERAVVVHTIALVPRGVLGPPVPSDAGAEPSAPSQMRVREEAPKASPESGREDVAKPAAQAAATPATKSGVKPSAKQASLTGTIDLNTATKAQLELLPSIGPAMAQRIVDERARVGKFASVEDLVKVKGIGEKTLAKLRPYVTVGTDSTPR